jgi:PAS domain-containing protein
MEKSLAEIDGAITILVSESTAEETAESSMPTQKPPITRRPGVRSRRSSKAPLIRSDGSEPVAPEGFYRDLVWNLRNGVLAVTRDGRVAVMNGVAYRILGLKPRLTDIGRHFTQVLKDQPDVARIIAE